MRLSVILKSFHICKLVENLIVSDFLKRSYNKGEQPQFYFYRDQRQHEVELLEEQPDGRLQAYEIKAGMTFRQDYFTQLTYLKEVLGDKLLKTQVIYDGSQENPQPNNGIINFRNIEG